MDIQAIKDAILILDPETTGAALDGMPRSEAIELVNRACEIAVECMNYVIREKEIEQTA